LVRVAREATFSAVHSYGDEAESASERNEVVDELEAERLVSRLWNMAVPDGSTNDKVSAALRLAETKSALVEVYDLSNDLDFNEAIFVKAGNETVVVEVRSAEPALGANPTPLIIKFLRPNCFCVVGASETLQREADHPSTRLVQRKPFALILLKAPGLPLLEWMEAKNWLVRKDGFLRDDTDARREAAVQIAVSLCRHLDGLARLKVEAHGNINYASTLVTQSPLGIETHLVDAGWEPGTVKTAVTTAPELGSQHRLVPTCQSDAYSIGVVVLQVMCSTPVSTASEVRKALFGLWGSSPRLACVIETLLDYVPARRISSDEPWQALSRWFERELRVSTVLDPPVPPGSLNQFRGAIGSWAQFRHYFRATALEVGSDTVRAPSAGVASSRETLTWTLVGSLLLSHVLWVLCLSAFLVLTSADSGLARPSGEVGVFLESYAPFRVGDLEGNTVGRVIGLSAAFVAMMFYTRILAGVTVRRSGAPLVEATFRLAPVLLQLPALYVVAYQPSAWVVTISVLALSGALVCGVMTWLDRRTLALMGDELGYRAGDLKAAQESRDRSSSWWKALVLCATLLGGVGALLDLPALKNSAFRLHDRWFFAVFVTIGIVYGVYGNSIRKIEQSVRGALEQDAFVVHRAQPWSAFAASVVPGAIVMFVPSLIIGAACVALVDAGEQRTFTVVLGVGSVLSLAAGVIATYFARRGTSVGLAHHICALGFALALWCGAAALTCISSLGPALRFAEMLLVGTLLAAFSNVGLRRAMATTPRISKARSRRRKTTMWTKPEIPEAFALARAQLDNGPDAVREALVSGLLPGHAVEVNSEGLAQIKDESLRLTWAASPRLGRAIERLSEPDSSRRLVLSSKEELAALESSLERVRRVGVLGWSDRSAARCAAVCDPDPLTEIKGAHRFLLESGQFVAVAGFVAVVVMWLVLLINDTSLDSIAARTLTLGSAICVVAYYLSVLRWVNVIQLKSLHLQIAVGTWPYLQVVCGLALYYPDLWPVWAAFGNAWLPVILWSMKKIAKHGASLVAAEAAPAARFTPKSVAESAWSSWAITSVGYTSLLGVLVLGLVITDWLKDGWFYALVIFFLGQMYILVGTALRNGGPDMRGECVRAMVAIRLRERELPPEQRAEALVAPTGTALANLPFVLLTMLGLAASPVSEPWYAIVFLGCGILGVAGAVFLTKVAGRHVDLVPSRAQALSRISLSVWLWAWVAIGVAAAVVGLQAPQHWIGIGVGWLFGAASWRRLHRL
jgi:hypothetical protein